MEWNEQNRKDDIKTGMQEIFWWCPQELEMFLCYSGNLKTSGWGRNQRKEPLLQTLAWNESVYLLKRIQRVFMPCSYRKSWLPPSHYGCPRQIHSGSKLNWADRNKFHFSCVALHWASFSSCLSTLCFRIWEQQQLVPVSRKDGEVRG